MRPGELAYIDGRLVPSVEAKISIRSLGARFGINVFEGLRAYWNGGEEELYVFRLDDHCRRLLQSAELMEIEHTYEMAQLRQSILDLLSGSSVREDVHIRQTLFVTAEEPLSARGPSLLTVTAKPRGADSSTLKGISCKMSSWTRISDRCMPPRIKCGANYHNSRLAALEARLCGFDNAIMLNESGTVAEAPLASVFLTCSNGLVTPDASQGILESITRASLIELCERDLHIPIVERRVDRTELLRASEVFLCGTATEVTPVVKIDNHTIGHGAVGDLTRQIAARYMAIVRGEVREFASWRVPVWHGESLAA